MLSAQNSYCLLSFYNLVLCDKHFTSCTFCLEKKLEISAIEVCLIMVGVRLGVRVRCTIRVRACS